MEKKKTLEAIAKMVKESGLPIEEVVSYLQENYKVSSGVPKKVFPGMYVYADGTISAEIIAGQQIKAVVGYVYGPEVLAVCLREKSLPWSDAVQYCQNYAEDGVKQGEAFLPSITELDRLYENKHDINKSLSALKVSKFRCEEYWSSAEYNNSYAWKLNFFSGYRYTVSKYSSNYVRPVIAFSL